MEDYFESFLKKGKGASREMSIRTKKDTMKPRTNELREEASRAGRLEDGDLDRLEARAED